MSRLPNCSLLLSLEGDVPDLDALLGRVRQGDPDAIVQLRQACAGGIRFFLERTFDPEDPESAAGRVFHALLRRLRDNDAPLSLAEAVRAAARDCGFVTPRRRRKKPPAARVRALKEALANCSELEREYLERCYLHGEDPAEVRDELGLSREEIAALHRRLGGPARMLLQARAAGKS